MADLFTLLCFSPTPNENTYIVPALHWALCYFLFLSARSGGPRHFPLVFSFLFQYRMGIHSGGSPLGFFFPPLIPEEVAALVTFLWFSFSFPQYRIRIQNGSSPLGFIFFPPPPWSGELIAFLWFFFVVVYFQYLMENKVAALSTFHWALHCNASQHIATHCNARNLYTEWQSLTHCNALQRTATHCNASQRIATHCNALQHTATHCNALQRTATHCNALQPTATHCNPLQRTATHYASLPLWWVASSEYRLFYVE